MEPQRKLTERVASLVRMSKNDIESTQVLSTGEQIAVALVLNRTAILPPDFIGPEWLSACRLVEKKGGMK